MSRLGSMREHLERVDWHLSRLRAVEDPRPSTLANIRALEKERRNLEAQQELINGED